MTSARREVTGHYAGGVTRFVAHYLDVAVAGSLFVVAAAVVDYALRSVTRVDTSTELFSSVRAIALVLWAFLYWWVPVAVVGRTPGKALLGLRILERRGAALSARRAALRAFVLPLSYAVAGLGFLGIVAGRERRALHDVIAGSTVVYDWGDRPAELPTPISLFLAKRAAGAVGEESSHAGVVQGKESG